MAQRLIIRRFSTFDRILQLKLKPGSGETATTVAPFPLTGTGVRGEMRARPGGPIIKDIAWTVTDAPNGKIQPQGLTPAVTGAIAAGNYIIDLLEDYAGGIVRNRGRIPVTIKGSTTEAA